MSPSIKELVELLSSILPGFDNVYIVIDALDECPKADRSRECLMDILVNITSWGKESLHLFLTSRKEIDIGRALGPCASSLDHVWTTSLQPGDIVEDVQTFVGQSLKERSFSKWKDSWKSEVKDALSSRAQGS